MQFRTTALDLPEAGAQNNVRNVEQIQPVGSDEQSMIRVAKQALPAVVSVSQGRGLGSGVLISSGGVLLTNAHVVGAATQVRVGLTDGRRLTGTVIGRDRSADVAVLRIAGNRFGKRHSAIRINLKSVRQQSPSATRWASTAPSPPAGSRH